MKNKIYKKVLALAVVFSVFAGSSFSVSAEGLSDVFDADYYAEQYPDVVAKVGSDPAALLNHFVTYGVNEGKQGIAAFNVSEYRNAYTDLQAAFGDNWNAYVEHYFTSGINENRTAGVYGTVTRTGNTAPALTSPTVPTVSETIQMIPSGDSALDNEAAVYEQIYIKLVTFDINDDAAVKELDSYIRANAHIFGEWGWMGSVDFTNGETLYLEIGQYIGLEIAGRGIDCYEGYSEVYSYSQDVGKSIMRTVDTNGVISAPSFY